MATVGKRTRVVKEEPMEDDISDTGSHLGDADYERDGFVVDDSESEAELSSEPDEAELAKLTPAEFKAYHKQLKAREEEEEDAFIAENKDKIVEEGHVAGGRILRTRRKPKTPQEIYDELCADVEDHEAELAEIEDELEGYKGKRLTAKERKDREELRKDQSFVKERLELLVQKAKDMEEDHRTYHGDIGVWEAEQGDIEGRLDELERAMAAAERKGDDKAYSKAGKEHKRLSTKLNKLEKQIADYHAEQDYVEASDSDVSMGESESEEEEPYTESSDYSEDNDDESDYSEEDSDYSD